MMSSKKSATKISKALMYALTAMVICLSLSACNTVEGIGRDARAAGDALTGAAQKSRGY